MVVVVLLEEVVVVAKVLLVAALGLLLVVLVTTLLVVAAGMAAGIDASGVWPLLLAARCTAAALLVMSFSRLLSFSLVSRLLRQSMLLKIICSDS